MPLVSQGHGLSAGRKTACVSLFTLKRMNLSLQTFVVPTFQHCKCDLIANGWLSHLHLIYAPIHIRSRSRAPSLPLSRSILPFRKVSPSVQTHTPNHPMHTESCAILIRRHSTRPFTAPAPTPAPGSRAGAGPDAEKDRLLETFVAWAKSICAELREQGHWAVCISRCLPPPPPPANTHQHAQSKSLCRGGNAFLSRSLGQLNVRALFSAGCDCLTTVLGEGCPKVFDGARVHWTCTLILTYHIVTPPPSRRT
jgi:hypothetical protein